MSMSKQDYERFAQEIAFRRVKYGNEFEEGPSIELVIAVAKYFNKKFDEKKFHRAIYQFAKLFQTGDLSECDSVDDLRIVLK